LNFHSFEIYELRDIAEEIAEKNNYKKSEIVKVVRDLNYQWVLMKKILNLVLNALQ
jgi:hypothetical protein